MTLTVIHPDGWAPAKGYANGMLTGDGTLYVGGQIGWTANQVFETHDFIGQMEQALRNILDVVQASGGKAVDPLTDKFMLDVPMRTTSNVMTSRSPWRLGARKVVDICAVGVPAVISSVSNGVPISSKNASTQSFIISKYRG